MNNFAYDGAIFSHPVVDQPLFAQQQGKAPVERVDWPGDSEIDGKTEIARRAYSVTEVGTGVNRFEQV